MKSLLFSLFLFFVLSKAQTNQRIDGTLELNVPHVINTTLSSGTSLINIKFIATQPVYFFFIAQEEKCNVSLLNEYQGATVLPNLLTSNSYLTNSIDRDFNISSNGDANICIVLFSQVYQSALLSLTISYTLVWSIENFNNSVVTQEQFIFLKSSVSDLSKQVENLQNDSTLTKNQIIIISCVSGGITALFIAAAIIIWRKKELLVPPVPLPQISSQNNLI